MATLSTNKILLLVFGVLLVSTKILLILALFFRKHDEFNNTAIIIGIIAILLGLLILIITFAKGVKENFKSLISLAVMLLIVFFFPFEYAFGWTTHQVEKNNRKQLVTDLKLGRFDRSIFNAANLDYGAWISTYPRIKAFRDSSIQLLFITRGDITSYDYYGTLYISDASKITERNLSRSLNAEFNRWSLGNNWYLVECYTDTRPGP